VNRCIWTCSIHARSTDETWSTITSDHGVTKVLTIASSSAWCTGSGRSKANLVQAANLWYESSSRARVRVNAPLWAIRPGSALNSSGHCKVRAILSGWAREASTLLGLIVVCTRQTRFLCEETRRTEMPDRTRITII